MKLSLEFLRKALESPPARSADEGLPPLDYPLFPAPRIAVLGLRLRPGSGIHALPQWTAADLRRIRPLALAGSWQDLSAVARLTLSGELQLPDLLYPIVVFSTPSFCPLAPELHDLLWDWFRVPTFEQIRGPRGELLAYECDARHGFHLARGANPSLLPLEQWPQACPCGSREPLFCAAPRAAAAVAAG